ncbi:MAG: TAXI family TRAP transporter solute-binding subunit [Rhodospirillales bacterium]|nr:TAXI family TRAP transporter solute-binding subunit [Rhodospirillales bacterium]
MKITMLKKMTAAVVAAGIMMPAVAGAEDIKIGAMRLGSAWYVFGATLSKLLKETMPGSNVEVVARGGGKGNPISVSKGKVQIALSNVATSVWAFNGHPVVYKGIKYSNIRGLVGGLNSVWVNAMVKDEYIKKTGNDTMEKIFGSGNVRVVMKPEGSSIPVVADMMMEALGSGRDAVKKAGGKIIQVGAKQIPALLRDGRADLYFEVGLKGHGAVTEATLTSNLHFMDMPKKVLDKLSKQGLAAKPMPVWFKGQTKPVMSVDMGTMIIANEKMSVKDAYTITKTIIENKAAMAKAHKAWSRFKPEDAWKPANTGIPLHPGAIKYYKERGWM